VTAIFSGKMQDALMKGCKYQIANRHP
jgi:hypothetical protein